MRNLLLVVLLALSSCATVLNKKSTSLKIVTSRPVQLQINDQPITKKDSIHEVITERKKESLNIKVQTEEGVQPVQVPSRLSPGFYLNFVTGYYGLPGLMVDLFSKKRFTYPHWIYLDIKEEGLSYLRAAPLHPSVASKKHIVKLSLTRPFSLDYGGLEASLERKFSPSMSGQLSATLISSALSVPMVYKSEKLRGVRLEWEQRYYFKKVAPKGGYLAMDFAYLHSKSYSIQDMRASNQYYTIEYKDRIGVRNNHFDLRLKLGQQFLTGRWVFDTFLGAGIRFKNTQHFDGINPEGYIRSPYFLGFNDIKYQQNRKGRFVQLIIPFGIKVGYLLP